MLSVTHLETCYGSVRALRDVCLEVGAGEMVSLIGGNGAGKSTTLKTISGLLRPRRGTVEFMGQRIEARSPGEIVRLGISHCPEGRRVWPRMTVRENLLMGAYVRSDRGEIAASLDRICHHFPILHERRDQQAGTLSGGEQQMLAIGRALMSGPRLLMLDEPSLGLSPRMIEEVARIIVDIHRAGTTVLLVEQNAYLALTMAQRGYVLETGAVVLAGPGRELLDNKHVRKAYLGTRGAATRPPRGS